MAKENEPGWFERNRKYVFAGISVVTLPIAGIATVKAAAAGEGLKALIAGLWTTSDAVTIRDTFTGKEKPTPILNTEWWAQKFFGKGSQRLQYKPA